MSLGNPRSGFNAVAEYLVPGLPFVVSTSVVETKQFAFPFVTRAVTVTNNSDAGTKLAVGFTQAGLSGDNYVLIDGGTSIRVEVRVRELWLAPDSGPVDVSILAELTAIERSQCLPLTGSAPVGWDPSSYILWEGVG